MYADIGWITGHSYIVYGPLLAEQLLMFEGVYPHPGKFGRLLKNIRSISFIRHLLRSGLASSWNRSVEKFDLSSLKVIGSVGEPINEEAWHGITNMFERIVLW